jgi:hypothetical protein
MASPVAALTWPQRGPGAGSDCARRTAWAEQFTDLLRSSVTGRITPGSGDWGHGRHMPTEPCGDAYGLVGLVTLGKDKAGLGPLGRRQNPALTRRSYLRTCRTGVPCKKEKNSFSF